MLRRRRMMMELVVALMLVELLPVMMLMLVEGRGRRSGLGCGTLRQHFRPVWLLILLLQGMMLLPREKLQMVVVEAGACALAAALLPGWPVTERCRRWRLWQLSESCRKAHARMEGLKLLQPTELLEQLLATGLLLLEERLAIAFGSLAHVNHRLHGRRTVRGRLGRRWTSGVW